MVKIFSIVPARAGLTFNWCIFSFNYIVEWQRCKYKASGIYV